MLRESPNLPGWADYPVRDEIERRLGTRVILENDANVAALGEKWLGAATRRRRHGHVDSGNRRWRRDRARRPNLAWHDWHGGRIRAHDRRARRRPCGCGNRGCVEQYASATAVVRMAKEAIAAGPRARLGKGRQPDPEFNARAIYNLAIQGDAEAKKIFGRVGRALGICIANLVNAFNLNMYVVGGGVSSAWEAFSPFIFEEVRQRSMVYAATAPPLLILSGRAHQGRWGLKARPKRSLLVLCWAAMPASTAQRNCQ